MHLFLHFCLVILLVNAFIYSFLIGYLLVKVSIYSFLVGYLLVNAFISSFLIGYLLVNAFIYSFLIGHARTHAHTLIHRYFVFYDDADADADDLFRCGSLCRWAVPVAGA